jgi:hypothetical protein
MWRGAAGRECEKRSLPVLRFARDRQLLRLQTPGPFLQGGPYVHRFSEFNTVSNRRRLMVMNGSKAAVRLFLLTANRLVLLVGTLGFALVGTASAQINVPFQVTSGAGTVDRLPSPTDPEQNHVINSGTAALGGNALNYTATARVRLLAPPNPMTGIAPFESASPVLFDFGNGDTLAMHYGRTDFGAPESGMVQLIPLPGGMVDTQWLAVFNPVPGSGTGQFDGVIGGAIFMTAITDPFDPTGTDIPYSWSSDAGSLTFVPEPSSLALVGAAALVMLVRLRRRRRNA